MKFITITINVQGEGRRCEWATMAGERQIKQLELELADIIEKPEYWDRTVGKRKLPK